ncbi:MULTISPECIES: O-antigen translocase [Acinetobacter calcoaceticus/baumannii complex]|uniref:O-antigen translocase n=1 Tax=Acinetobacter calcoaceticus/baumannii complex TaxID=909768 RepID=UPI00044CAD72|nr:MULTISPECIES: O-antigen translocase [Acinetobacter calcoaceticus/baumannii complex]EXB67495.1 polysaccharide biosynthesis family protein [Acinetobacter sp. 21871]EXR60956.1 polysaccharide biosynthesis family protein [Acinetobacter sp. 1424608]MBJ9725745.1 O-antigen translocase [Acinetobacter nosocomialis]HEM7794493.1 O-antigen translocase [Acinetobacter nosocomialis]
MNLLKTSVLNGVAVLIKTATLFVLNKILAIYVGPAGYAAIGQFQNFIQMVTTFAGTAINNGVVKYTAEYYDDQTKQQATWRTASTIILSASLIFSFFIVVFQEKLSIYIFHTNNYKNIFIWFAIFLPFFTFNALFLAILNGKKEVLRLVIANIIGSLFSLVITSVLAVKYSLYGALVSLSIYQSLVFFVTLFLCYKADWFKIAYLFGKIDKNIAQKFSAFALMAFVSVFFGNVAQISLRTIIINKFDIFHAGYWDAMTRLSGGYLMFVSTIIGVYYLPKLAELKFYKEIKNEVFYGYKYIFPIVIAISGVIFFFKELIVKVLFTDKFMPMLDLLAWQLTGDVIKVGSWIVSYMMLSQAMTKIFIITETFFALSIIPITIVLTQYFGFKGVAMAFALNNLLYWIVCSIWSFAHLKRY